MSEQQQLQLPRSEITLRGSTEICTEFFGYALHSILYQRGVYPPESFSPAVKYGLTCMVSHDEGLRVYLAQVLRQVAEWLSRAEVQQLVVVFTGIETRQVLERWVFKVETDAAALAPGAVRQKSHKEIQAEIAAIIRQVTASVTFLPLLDEPVSFELLAHTDTAAVVPGAWAESDPRHIAGATSEVQLRSMTTRIHTVAPKVSYRARDEL